VRNFKIELIYFPQITAGGSVLLNSKILMTSLQKTFAVALSRRMAPSAHIFLYCIVHGEIVVESLSFFVRDSKLKQV